MDNLPVNINNYLKINQFEKSLKEINDNSSNINSFVKRFFNWFDAFRVLKFLNFAHENYYKKQSVLDESEKLLKLISKDQITIKNHKNYLKLFRDLERRF